MEKLRGLKGSSPRGIPRWERETASPESCGPLPHLQDTSSSTYQMVNLLKCQTTDLKRVHGYVRKGIITQGRKNNSSPPSHCIFSRHFSRAKNEKLGTPVFILYLVIRPTGANSRGATWVCPPGPHSLQFLVNAADRTLESGSC